MSGSAEAPRRGWTAGKLIGIGFAALTVVTGVAVYWLQGHHYYQEVSGVQVVEIGERSFAVSGYQGLDHPVLPLRLRGCFTLDDPAAARSAGAPADRPEPFGAPSWFDCWDAPALDADIQAGLADVIVAGERVDGDFRFERLMAVYPDGRAFMWRRLVDD